MSGISGKKKQADVLGTIALFGLIAGAVAIWGHITLKAFLNFSLALVALYWFLVIVTVPWGLYFRTRAVQHEIGLSRARGIHISETRDTEVRRLSHRLLWAAIGGHVISAAIVTLVTFATGHIVGYYFAGFYLLGTAFRPVAAYFVSVKSRIAALLKETRYPRDDVLELKNNLETLTAEITAHRDTTTLALERTTREIDSLRDDLRTASARHREDLRLARESFVTDHSSIQARLNSVDGHMTTMNRHLDEAVTGVDQRMTTMARNFDEAVDGVTDQQELISGIRAFVRMVRESPTP